MSSVSFGPQLPSSMQVTMPRELKEYLPSTKGYVECVNTVLLSLSAGVAVGETQAIREAVLDAWQKSLDMNSKQTSNPEVIRNDIRLRSEVDRKLNRALDQFRGERDDLEATQVYNQIRELINSNQKVIAHDQSKLRTIQHGGELRGRKDTKRLAVASMKKLIRNAYAYKSKDGFKLVNSLGRWRGINSSQNQELFEILKKDYGEASTTAVREDGKRVIKLIQDGFVKGKKQKVESEPELPEKIAKLVDGLNVQLSALTKARTVKAHDLKGETAADRYAELKQSVTGLKLEKMPTAEARRLVLAVVFPEAKQWPTASVKEMMMLAARCDPSKISELRAEQEEFKDLCDRAGVYSVAELQEQVVDLIDAMYKYKGKSGFVLEESLGKFWNSYLGIDSSENKTLKETRKNMMRTDIADKTISQFRSEVNEVLRLLEKAFIEGGEKIPKSFANRMQGLRLHIELLK